MERTVLEKCHLSSLQAGRWSDRYLHEYAECRAECGRVVPVARSVLPATLMGYTLVFSSRTFVLCRLGNFWLPGEQTSRMPRNIHWNSCLSGFGVQPPTWIGGRLMIRME